MKKIDVGQTVGILANIGVIAGILLLAVELNQNNELLKAQARHNQLNTRSLPFTLILNNEEQLLVNFKAASGETLTAIEQYRYGNWAIVLFQNWEWQYDEFKAGTLAEEDLPVNAWTSRFRDTPIFSDIWERTKVGRSPEFVQFMEENVINEL